MAEKERVSLAIEPDLLHRFDKLIQGSGGNRSEAVRDLIRERLIEQDVSAFAKGECVGTITLVYAHNKRELADRLLEMGHDHHHTVMASMHVHLDHDNCLEVIAVRGTAKVLRTFANYMIGLKGVKHGKLVLTSASI
jgi:CopG family transcriptional regulator, nickel-responsive regulator